MSHIPSAAMPHAVATHPEEPATPKPPAPPAADKHRARPGGWPLAAIALGGALALGAVAVAVPLLRTPAKKPKGRAKGKRRARV